MVLFLDFKNNQKTDHLSLCGIINAKVFEKTTSTGKVFHQRIPVILPCLTQCLIDLWSDSPKIKPKFSSNWKIFQVIVFTNLSYAGEVTVSGQRIKVFRRGYRYPKYRQRYIWLSEEEKSFWIDPIKRSEFETVQDCFETWPETNTILKGYLKMSKGSIITCKFAKPVKSEDIEPFGFESLQRLHLKLKKSLCGYINLYSGKSTGAQLKFERFVKILKYYIKVE